jgi:hypothetical protein
VPRQRCSSTARPTTARRSGSGHAGSILVATQDDSHARKSSGASRGSKYLAMLSNVDKIADRTASSPEVNRWTKSSPAYSAGSIAPNG